MNPKYNALTTIKAEKIVRWPKEALLILLITNYPYLAGSGYEKCRKSTLIAELRERKVITID